MKIGDLVIRKIPTQRDCNNPSRNAALTQRNDLGYGLVISKTMAGYPEHLCLNVYYTKVGKSYDIAESLMEVVSEIRSSKN